MLRNRALLLFGGLALVAGCAEEPPPRSVNEFIDSPMMLEAAMVRCAQNRSQTRYDAECVNARQAVSIIEAKEERERRAAFEKESNRKREALRRTQQAAAEARRRANEAARQRREAEYLAQFGELPPPPDGQAAADGADANAPGAVIPEAGQETEAASETMFEPLPERERAARPVESVPIESVPVEAAPASDGGNAPAVESTAPRDLNAIREELRKRNEESGD